MGSVIEITNSEYGIISGNLARRYGTYENSDITITDCIDMSVVSNSTEGDIIVTRTPEVNVEGNKARSIQLWTCDHGTVAGSVLNGGLLGVTDSDDASVIGNTITKDDLGGTPWAILVDGASDGVVVTNNVYQGVPHGSVESVADAGMYIASGVTNANIGWNHFGKATYGVDDNGTGTVHLDAVPHTFGTDANPLIVGGGVQPYPYSGSGTVIGARAVLGVAPTGARFVCDVHVNGSSIYNEITERLIIADGATDSGVSQATSTYKDLSDGDIFTISIDEIGSTTAGGFLTVVIYIRPNGT